MLIPAAGSLLLLLLAIDVFLTVIHPEGHGGPLTRRQNRLLWALWKAAAPRSSRREAWLGLAAPTLAVLTPAIWAALLVTGFALLYFPAVEGFLVSPGALRAHWAESLYVSGIAAATLGTGDVVPDSIAVRLLTVVEALSGFALLSAALSYILSIHTEHAVKTTLAADIAAQFDASARSDEDPFEREQWLDGVTQRLLHVMHAHAQYPILHYFHPADRRDSLTVQLAPFVERMTDASRDARSVADGAATAAVERYLRAAQDRFLPPSKSPDHEGDGSAATYARLRRYLAY